MIARPGAGPERSRSVCFRKEATVRRRTRTRDRRRERAQGLRIFGSDRPGQADGGTADRQVARTFWSAWHQDRGIIRATGWPNETGATPERARKDRAGRASRIFGSEEPDQTEHRQTQARRSGARQQCRAPFLFWDARLRSSRRCHLRRAMLTFRHPGLDPGSPPVIPGLIRDPGSSSSGD